MVQCPAGYSFEIAMHSNVKNEMSTLVRCLRYWRMHKVVNITVQS